MIEEALDEESSRGRPPSLLENYISLDTIQESRESSSLSGEDTDGSSATGDTDLSLTKSNEDIEKCLETCVLSKVKWMHEDDGEDEEDDNEEDEDEGKEDYSWEPSHPDEDRKWAWVVLGSVFFMFIINSGLLSCTGLYYAQMLEEFGHSRSYTAWLGSLINAFFMLTGPVSSVAIKSFGCRASVVLGGILISVGYLLTATAQSLSAVFFTYGVLVACGMNFVYSGEIIALAQYFHRYHSIATAASMVGVGVGTLFMVPVIDFAIAEYGWRTSFVFCAGISLQLCVFGSLLFPPKSHQKQQPQASLDHSSLYSAAFSDRTNNRNYCMDRSISSLQLSVGAGYICSSFSNLNVEPKSATSFLGSNQQSFCSRGSQYIGDIRSNQSSFAHFGDFPGGVLWFVRSNQQSFNSCGSFGFQSLKSTASDALSFKNSQLDVRPVPPLRSVPTAKDTEGRHEALGQIPTEKVEINSGVFKAHLMSKKMKEALKVAFNGWHLEIFSDACFVFLNVSMFFSMLATIKLFIVYKDLSRVLGVDQFYFQAVSAIGVGDIVGRVSIGAISTRKNFSAVAFFALNIYATGLVIGCYLLSMSGSVFILVSSLLGVLYGQQCVLVTFVVSPLFGNESLVTAFGYILFTCGLGALVGAPLAGKIVDCTGNYNGVICLSMCSCLIGGTFMFFCHKIFQMRQRKQRELAQFLA